MKTSAVWLALWVAVVIARQYWQSSRDGEKERESVNLKREGRWCTKMKQHLCKPPLGGALVLPHITSPSGCSLWQTSASFTHVLKSSKQFLWYSAHFLVEKLLETEKEGCYFFLEKGVLTLKLQQNQLHKLSKYIKFSVRTLKKLWRIYRNKKVFHSQGIYQSDLQRRDNKWEWNQLDFNNHNISSIFLPPCVVFPPRHATTNKYSCLILKKQLCESSWEPLCLCGRAHSHLFLIPNTERSLHIWL